MPSHAFCYGSPAIIMCLLTTTPSPCNHAECQSPDCCLTPKAQFPEFRLSSALYIGMLQMNQLLVGMAGQNAQIVGYLDTIAGHFQTCGSKRPKPQMLEIPFSWPLPENRTYHTRLELVEESPNQVFKERGFSLTLRLFTSDSLPRKAAGLHFKICLYSQESPPKRVLLNISGKKILRGTIETESDTEGFVKFGNIVINEVSSHYINDAFYLVVAHSGGLDIKPFILESFSVRARKPVKRMFKTSICDIDELANS